MQSLAIDQLVGRTLGNYRVESLLGQGRLNAVFLARNLISQRTDALTLYIVPARLPNEARGRFISRFLKEAAAIAALHHPHILPVYEYGEHAGYPYLVTPYMMNGSLADILKQGRCDHAYVVAILEQVVGGLEYAHSKGLVHGTLKPSNIVLNSDSTMLVAGFGLMHMLQMRGIEYSDKPYAHLLSIADTFLAAPEYLAPEIVQGQSIDARSDIYALGIILFELLSGKPPFTGTNPLEIATQHVKRSVPSLRALSPDVPVALESVVNQALDRDSARRFQHASELAEAFAQVSLGVTGKLQHHTANQRAIGVDKAMPSPVASSNGYSTAKMPGQTGSWQLMPPIVTGQFPLVNAPAPMTSPQMASPQMISPQRTAGSSDTWQLLPPIVTGVVPAVQPSTPPRSGQLVPPIVTGTTPAFRSSTPPRSEPANAASAPLRLPPQQVAPEPVSMGRNTDSMKPFEWWSQPGHAEEESRSTEPRRPREPAQPQAPLLLDNSDLAGWGVEPIQPLPSSTNNRWSKKRPRGTNLKRRSVVAALAGGGVAAAGGLIAVNAATMQHMAMGLMNKMQTMQMQSGAAATGANQQQNMPQTAKTNAPAGNNQPATGHTGTVVGTSNMVVNSAMDFTNPVDNKPSMLIRLPNGNFVAYEKACTHEGVIIHYDKGTHTMVCPAHGAIFDPTNGGAVLQGPATTPVAKVNVRVNADGTITTG